MPVSVYDRMYSHTERIRDNYREEDHTGIKQRAIYGVRSAAQEFAAIAEEWEEWATEKENELVEKGEL